jgi:hypothetical protein
MKRKSDWRGKLDAQGLEFIEGYRKISAIRNTDTSAYAAKLQDIAEQHPEIRNVGRVDVLPEFLDVLLKSEHATKLLATFQPTPGSKTLPQTSARFIELMQGVTIGLENPELRVAAGVISAITIVVLEDIYKSVSKARFGDAGPTKEGEFSWTLGTTLETLAKILKTGKAPKLKGKVNVELVELIKVLREHAQTKLSYRELQEALEYAGVYVGDEESLRLFEWRARKKGWIKSTKIDPKGRA